MPPYRGWEPDAMKPYGENAALPSDTYIPPTSFTPINRPGAQLLTPQRLGISAPIDQTGTVDSTRQLERHHHPIVTQYLNLGAEAQPSHPEKPAQALPARLTPPPKSRKRVRKARDRSSPNQAVPPQPKTTKQRRISDSNAGFRVTKAASSDSRFARNDVTSSNVSLTAAKTAVGPPSETDKHFGGVQRSSGSPNATWKRPTECSISTSTTTLTQSFAALAKSSPKSSCTLVDPKASREQARSEDQSQDPIPDEFFDDVFDSVDLDYTFHHSGPTTWSGITQNASVCETQADSSATVCVEDEPTPSISDGLNSSPQLTGSEIQSQSESTDRDSVVPNVPGPFGKFISPATRKTEAVILDEVMSSSRTTDRKPIVRHMFPDPVRDRSPIVGLSSKSLLRTCFRVGEAISQAGKATKYGQNNTFELYARVLSSERDAAKQHFVFSDLFHNRPPYLKGEYDAAIWKQVELFNYDSGRFLSKAKMCRCIGKIKRNDKDHSWVMVVLNIWEATWEDVDWVKGIVDS